MRKGAPPPPDPQSGRPARHQAPDPFCALRRRGGGLLTQPKTFNDTNNRINLSQTETRSLIYCQIGRPTYRERCTATTPTKYIGWNLFAWRSFWMAVYSIAAAHNRLITPLLKSLQNSIRRSCLRLTFRFTHFTGDGVHIHSGGGWLTVLTADGRALQSAAHRRRRAQVYRSSGCGEKEKKKTET